ncbi:uncharacterized protein LOC132294026 isoform X2 [Cornus florida]|uniref:uncharacterized protein LOC132294026 isoform X2 n=1 Tax=Cornus florida TaxID=4283 RepID=UPI00289C5099|nr:uncharacterized protein LOC132294026 isoform X2 [Cornus florida]
METWTSDLNYAPQEAELWPVSKELTDSDTSTRRGRVQFPGRPFRQHIVDHMDHHNKRSLDQDPNQTRIGAVDDDTSHVYEVKLTNEGSTFSLGAGWNHIIRRRELRAKMLIKLRWGLLDHCLHFTIPPPQSHEGEDEKRIIEENQNVESSKKRKTSDDSIAALIQQDQDKFYEIMNLVRPKIVEQVFQVRNKKQCLHCDREGSHYQLMKDYFNENCTYPPEYFHRRFRMR